MRSTRAPSLWCVEEIRARADISGRMGHCAAAAVAGVARTRSAAATPGAVGVYIAPGVACIRRFRTRRGAAAQMDWGSPGWTYHSVVLVLSRRPKESIMIGGDIVLTVLEVRGDQVRIGIEAPRAVEVHREEIYREIHDALDEAAAATDP